MKVLISIKPKWCVLIMNGDKTIEIRKTCPAIFKHLHSYEGATLEVYIYCTKEDSLGRIKELPKDRYFVDCVETPQDFAKMDSGYDGKGKVVAKFTLNKVEEIRTHTITITNTYGVQRVEATNDTQSLNKTQLLKSSCLNSEQLNNYLDTIWWNGKTHICGYAWHISNLEIFDKPKELSDFHKIINIKKCDTNYCDDLYSCSTCDHSKITKAPQSWCYVEE